MERRMIIKKNDGIEVINFIEKTLKIELPQSGFLAGQSVCSALLFLKKKSTEFHINDLDVFLPKSTLSKSEIISFNKKQKALIQNLNPFTNKQVNNTINITLGNPYFNLNEKEKINQELSDIKIKTDHITSIFTKKAKQLQIDLPSKAILEYQEKTRKNLLFLFNQKNSYYNNSKVSFELHKNKRVFDSKRSGIFNYIYVQYFQKFSNIDVFSPSDILNDFDINCTQVGVDLKTKKIYYTPQFLYFFNTLNMEIINSDTPYHSIIRYFNKVEEFNYNGSCELESLHMHNQLSFGLPSIATNDSYSYVTKPCFGDIYLKKFNKSKRITDFFSMENFNTKSISDFRSKHNFGTKDYPLFKLKGLCDNFKYIQSGQHKIDFEKRTGFKIEHGYANYLHFNMKKIIIDNSNYTNKVYSILNNDKSNLVNNLSIQKQRDKIKIVNKYFLEDISKEQLDQISDILTSFHLEYECFLFKFFYFKDFFNTIVFIHDVFTNTKNIEVLDYIKNYSIRNAKNDVKKNSLLPIIKKNIEKIELKTLEEINYITNFKEFKYKDYTISPIYSLSQLKSLYRANNKISLAYKLSMKIGETQVYQILKGNNLGYFIITKHNNELLLIDYQLPISEYDIDSNKDEVRIVIDLFYKENNIKKCINYKKYIES